jgi:hypothetical protein
MVTVDEMIAALVKFKADHGGNSQIVKNDPSERCHFVQVDHIGLPAVVVEDSGGYLMDEGKDPRAVPVFVIIGD